MSVWASMQTRRKLFKAFKAGEIYRKIDDHFLYPKIRNVSTNDNSTTITFTLPTGLDPKLIEKRHYVFEQIFGKYIEIDGEIKRFTLTVYKMSMVEELTYKADAILKEVKGKRLGIVCGMDRNGRYVSLDLLTMPHVLVAGETGSGKSTQLRSILTTLILSKKPSELQLYLADCKKSEFHLFRKVEHVKCVLSKPSEIARMLRHIKKELDERSDLTETFEVGHVDDLPSEHKRPYIVVCIDEFVMLRKDDYIMDVLTELVAIGRTLGVFAILSMQRPNAQVLDTTIRANLTVSMGFKLRDMVESRIVNTPGAERIEKSGRLIMNSDRVYELQAPYLTMDEAKKMLNPFMVTKTPVKEVKPEEAKQLTEKDVFNDVN
ncbi:FtsK/SpoIIIE domain-containing protein [Heyndrickxia ginsengihumi]|uniref:FtsK/SpoIIIE domain-containing protein n=1 Tax=Heyndrickxia ginsengihumi TaxID=363870 RepID=UPI003D21341A